MNSAVRPEPVLRPKGMGRHSLDVVRNARVYMDGPTVVVRRRSGKERRYPVGGEGIRSAVFYPPPDADDSTAKNRSLRWGTLVFEGAEGRHLLQIPLADWLPEAGIVSTAQLTPEACLVRTGAKQLVELLGIPLELSRQPWSQSVSSAYGRGRRDVAAHRELPIWHSWVRGIGTLVWLLALLFPSLLLGDQDRWGIALASAALLVVVLVDPILRGVTHLRSRGGEYSLRTATVVPPPRVGATRRFCRTAGVRVLPADVVLTNGFGGERRIARDGVGSVARLVRLTHAGTGEPLGLELRDGTGQARALLPWHWWFSGPDGGERWLALTSALKVPHVEEKLKSRAADAAESWHRSLEFSADVLQMSPTADAKEARRQTSWYGGTLRDGTWMLAPVFAVLTLVVALAGDGGASVWLTGACVAATLVVVLWTTLGHWFLGRFTLDVPAVKEAG
ncbi:hypothetical protein [Streptomyces sp. NPDC059009]|uniref:hypothetical protein n=1 Tax=Streptomyces sp. NPDC059009 TaxID=3346694 RepID=UPI0036B4313C